MMSIFRYFVQIGAPYSLSRLEGNWYVLAGAILRREILRAVLDMNRLSGSMLVHRI